jgi:hypothetical protein
MNFFIIGSPPLLSSALLMMKVKSYISFNEQMYFDDDTIIIFLREIFLVTMLNSLMLCFVISNLKVIIPIRFFV